MDPIALTSLIVGIIALYFGWLQVDHRFKKGQLNKPSSEHNVLNDILSKKSITIGWFNYPPFVESNNNSEVPIGIYPLLAQKIASKYDLKVVWKQLNLSETVEAVRKRDVDIVVSVFQTPNRARNVDFTSFLHSITVSGVIKSTINDIHSQSDLLTSNYSITVAKNEIGHEFVDAIKIPKSRITVVDGNDISKIISFVKSGDTDIVLIDSVSIKNYFAKTPKSERKNIKEVFKKRPLAICHNGIMILQNQIDLANWLDTVFRDARSNNDAVEYENNCLMDYEEIVSKS